MKNLKKTNRRHFQQEHLQTAIRYFTFVIVPWKLSPALHPSPTYTPKYFALTPTGAELQALSENHASCWMTWGVLSPGEMRMVLPGCMCRPETLANSEKMLIISPQRFWMSGRTMAMSSANAFTEASGKRSSS